MSKLTELLALIPRGIKNFDKILEGHINNIKLEYGHLSEDKQNEIIRRRMICETCPLNSKNAPSSEEYVLLYNNHYHTDRVDFHCSICGCPTHTKTASLESNCGLEWYNDTHPSNPQPLKWTKYDSEKS